MTDHELFSNTEETAEQGRTSTGRGRRYAITGGAAAVVLAAGGSIAWAASGASADGHQSGSTPATSSSSALPSAAPSSAPSGTLGRTPPNGAPNGRPRTMTPSLDGTVSAVHGTQIIIKDVQGFTRTIETSGKTTYKNGLTASPSTGTRIHAEGTVDSNGTSLDATLIEKPPAHPRGGPGAPGGAPVPKPGIGAPSGHSAPSGAPAGAPKGRPAAGAVPSGAPTTGS